MPEKPKPFAAIVCTRGRRGPRCEKVVLPPAPPPKPTQKGLGFPSDSFIGCGCMGGTRDWSY